MLQPLQDRVVGSVGNVLWILMGTIGMVLLVACFNVASLLLVRTEARQQELAVRASLGAGYLDEEGIVSCPWHAWRFCIRDGKWADNPRLGVDTFEVRVRGDEIQVRPNEKK